MTSIKGGIHFKSIICNSSLLELGAYISPIFRKVSLECPYTNFLGGGGGGQDPGGISKVPQIGGDSMEDYILVQ